LVASKAKDDDEKVLAFETLVSEKEGDHFPKGHPKRATRKNLFTKDKNDKALTRICFRILNAFYPSPQPTTPSSLHKACEKGSKFTARRLLYRGVDINAEDTEKRTPLYQAVVSGHAEVARLLLKWNASVNAADSESLTPLMAILEGYTAYKNRSDIVKLLLEFNADVDLADSKGRRAVQLAISNRATAREQRILKMILDAGADLDSPENNTLNRPLHLAIVNNDAKSMTSLLDAGASTESTDLMNRTPLNFAIESARPRLAKLLIERGADVNSPSIRWETPLFIAAQKGDMATVNALIVAGADLDAAQTEQHTALHTAVFNNKPDVLQALLTAGASVDARGRFGETALTLAAQDGRTKCGAILLAAGASIRLEQGSPTGIVIGNALACARKWDRSDELTAMLEAAERNEDMAQPTGQGPEAPLRSSGSLQSWFAKFIVQVYNREQKDEVASMK
jgi:ankyrin repeat protein